MRSLPLFTTLLFAIATLPYASAQNPRPIVGTAPFFHSARVAPESAAEIQTMVKEELFESERFEMVEVEQIDAISHELYEQGDERYMEGVVAAIAPKGAQYLLLGTVTDIRVEESRDEEGRTYAASVIYDLRKVSVGTREVVCHARIRSRLQEKAKSALRETATSFLRSAIDGTPGKAVAKTIGATSPKAALESAIEDTRPQVSDFVSSCFPVTYEVLAIESEDEAGQIREVLVAGTSTKSDFRAGTGLEVVERQHFELRDGTVRTREVPVAALSVVELQQGGFAVCEVRSGADALREALDSGIPLIVRLSR